MTNPEMTYHPNGQIHIITHRNAYGNIHNDNGSAFIRFYNNGQKQYEIYFKDGKWHNLTGPARIAYNDNGQKQYEEYWVDDEKVDGHKLIQELGINPDYTLWTDDEKDMFALHLMLEVS